MVIGVVVLTLIVVAGIVLTRSSQQPPANPEVARSSVPPQQTAEPVQPERTIQESTANPIAETTAAKNPTEAKPDRKKLHPSGYGMNNVVGKFDYWTEVTGRSLSLGTTKYQVPARYTIPENWSVVPDPGIQLDVPDTAARSPIQIPIPKGSGIPTSADIIFPVVPSRFVSVGQHATENDRRVIFDLPQRKVVGTIRELARPTLASAISPQGSMIAGLTKESKLFAYDVQRSTISWEIEVANKTHVAIPSEEHIVVWDDDQEQLDVLSVRNGSSICKMSAPGPPSGAFNSVAFSPGGRQIAVIHKSDDKDFLKVFEISTGTQLGELVIPHYALDTLAGLNPVGLSFSHDGEQIAIATSTDRNSKIYTINVRNAVLTRNLSFSSSLSGVGFDRFWTRKGQQTFAAVRWFPQNEFILVNEHAIVDLSTGETMYKIPESGVPFPSVRHPIHRDFVTVLNVNNDKGFIYVLPVGDELPGRDDVPDSTTEIAKVPVTHLELGPVIEAKFATKITLGEQTSWQVFPSSSAEISLKTTSEIPIYSQSGVMSAITMTRGAPYALVSRRMDDRTFGTTKRSDYLDSVPNAPSFLDLYNLQTGERIREIVTPHRVEPFSVAPDGTKFLCISFDEGDHVSLVSLPEADVIRTWKPGKGNLKSAEFIDDTHLLTYSANGEVAVWKVEGGNVSNLWFMDEVSFPSSSPDGKYLGCLWFDLYLFLESQTGTIVGSMPLDGTLLEVEWSPSGKQIVFSTEDYLDGFLRIGKTTTGELGEPFVVPIRSDRVNWVNDQYLLLGNEKLIDVQQEAVAWSFDFYRSDPLVVSCDDKFWYVGATEHGPVLTSTPLLSHDVSKVLATAKLSKNHALKPGDNCELVVDVGSLEDSDFEESIRTKYSGLLISNGWQVGPSNVARLVVAAREENPGDAEWKGYIQESNLPSFLPISSSSTDAKPYSFMAPNRTMECSIALEVAGVTVWEDHKRYRSFLRQFQIKKGENPADIFLTRYRDQCRDFFVNILLPSYVYTPQAANGVGRTRLTGIEANSN